MFNIILDGTTNDYFASNTTLQRLKSWHQWLEEKSQGFYAAKLFRQLRIEHL
jgi:hypothetical protein